MTYTKHSSQRMNQRGITGSLMETVMDFGVQKNDRYTLNKKDACKAIEKLREKIKWLIKVADKGGLTVVSSNGVFVTAWNNY